MLSFFGYRPLAYRRRVGERNGSPPSNWDEPFPIWDENPLRVPCSLEDVWTGAFLRRQGRHGGRSCAASRAIASAEGQAFSNGPAKSPTGGRALAKDHKRLTTLRGQTCRRNWTMPKLTELHPDPGRFGPGARVAELRSRDTMALIGCKQRGSRINAQG